MQTAENKETYKEDDENFTKVDNDEKITYTRSDNNDIIKDNEKGNETMEDF